MTNTEVLGRVDELSAAGRLLDALDLLVRHRRSHPAPEIDRMIVRFRHEAFAELQETDPRPVEPSPRVESTGPLTTVPAGELTVPVLREAIARHGCLLVKGLIDATTAATLRAGIDRALAAFDARQEGAASPEDATYFTPFVPRAGDYRIGGRRFMRESGGLWAVDSPKMFCDLTEVIADTGTGSLIEEYLGERPALSGNKCNLRRVPTTTATNWHQDGAFLGREISSLNLWLALGPCGIDAPGLDIVPRRLTHIVETGTTGAMFDWSVSPDKVTEAADGVDIVRPVFEEGDALLFDHLLLHRTGVSDGMTRERHAIEAWFFAPSSYPAGQIPVVY